MTNLSRGFRRLWRLLFGRTTIFGILLIAQIVVLVYGVYYLRTELILFNNVLGVIAVILIFFLLNTRMNSSFRLMWVIVIIAAPLVGVPLFLLTKFQNGTNHLVNTVDKLVEEQRDYLTPDSKIVEKIVKTSKQELGMFRYMYEVGSFPVYDNCEVKYLPSGEEKFEEMLLQLEQAEKFIFLEYFIIDKGHMWDRILEVLKRKAAEGVEVRVMYDGTCTLSLLPLNYPKKLRSFGIRTKVFFPMKPFLSTHQNNRDHRKILVIDGHTAFTGGVNLADEYINERERFGHWKDVAVMVKGRAVNSLTLLFLQMWNVTEGYMEECDQYLFDYESDDLVNPNGGFVAPYGDSPYSKEELGKKIYMNILNRANSYVHIMTPYLILDEEMTNALIFAAQRGVDVKIIMPHIPDKKYAYYLARTYYEDLIEGGVKIYEYTPGFVHAKVFVSDDERAVVGTINMDFRSLFLHFECATYMWRNDAIKDIEIDYKNTLEKCQNVTLQDCRDYSDVIKFVGRALRFIAPLM